MKIEDFVKIDKMRNALRQTDGATNYNISALEFQEGMKLTIEKYKNFLGNDGYIINERCELLQQMMLDARTLLINTLEPFRKRWMYALKEILSTWDMFSRHREAFQFVSENKEIISAETREFLTDSVLRRGEALVERAYDIVAHAECLLSVVKGEGFYCESSDYNYVLTENEVVELVDCFSFLVEYFGFIVYDEPERMREKTKEEREEYKKNILEVRFDFFMHQPHDNFREKWEKILLDTENQK